MAFVGHLGGTMIGVCVASSLVGGVAGCGLGRRTGGAALGGGIGGPPSLELDAAIACAGCKLAGRG